MVESDSFRGLFANLNHLTASNPMHIPSAGDPRAAYVVKQWETSKLVQSNIGTIPYWKRYLYITTNTVLYTHHYSHYYIYNTYSYIHNTTHIPTHLKEE